MRGKLEADRAGQPESRAIVLVHGAGGSRTAWTPQLAALSDSYCVIAPDLPGYGARTAEPFRLDLAVETLREAIQMTAGRRALIVGQSLGGIVAAAFAARYPGRVAGLVLSGTTPYPSGLFGLLGGNSLRGTLQNLGLPLLLVNGADDVAARQGESALQSATQAWVDVIQGAGTLPNVEQPDAFSASVRNFALAIGWVSGLAGEDEPVCRVDYIGATA